jgi:hypothetical protein
MPSISFDEFKSYFEFALEISGVVGGIGAVLYKVDAMNAIWKVARGRANSADEALAIEAIQEGGAVVQQVLRHTAQTAEGHGYVAAARRLAGLRDEANRSRDVSPGQMV